MKIRIFFEGNCPDEFQSPYRVSENIVDIVIHAESDEHLLNLLYSKGFTGIRSITFFDFVKPRTLTIPFPFVRKFIEPYSNQFR